MHIIIFFNKNYTYLNHSTRLLKPFPKIWNQVIARNGWSPLRSIPEKTLASIPSKNAQHYYPKSLLDCRATSWLVRAVGSQ